jgi:hypothetical protein
VLNSGHCAEEGFGLRVVVHSNSLAVCSGSPGLFAFASFTLILYLSRYGFMLPIFGCVVHFENDMTSISTNNGQLKGVTVVLPREKERATTLPFRYQFAAGAVAGISEVSAGFMI